MDDTNSLQLEDSFLPEMLDTTVEAGPSPVVFIDKNFLPSGGSKPKTMATFQTPMPMRTPAVHNYDSPSIVRAVESINDLKTQFEARFNDLSDKLEFIANNNATDSGEILQSRAHSKLHIAENAQQCNSRSNTSSAVNTTTTPTAEMVQSRKFPGASHPENASLLQLLSQHNLIVISPEALDKIVEDKVNAKILEHQQSFMNQSLMEIRVRTLESSLVNISKSVTSLSHNNSFGNTESRNQPASRRVSATIVGPGLTDTGAMNLDMINTNGMTNSVQNLYEASNERRKDLGTSLGRSQTNMRSSLGALDDGPLQASAEPRNSDGKGDAACAETGPTRPPAAAAPPGANVHTTPIASNQRQEFSSDRIRTVLENIRRQIPELSQKKH